MLCSSPHSTSLVFEVIFRDSLFACDTQLHGALASVFLNGKKPHTRLVLHGLHIDSWKCHVLMHRLANGSARVVICCAGAGHGID